jgi:hypothetical protein
VAELEQDKCCPDCFICNCCASVTTHDYAVGSGNGPLCEDCNDAWSEIDSSTTDGTDSDFDSDIDPDDDLTEDLSIVNDSLAAKFEDQGICIVERFIKGNRIVRTAKALRIAEAACGDSVSDCITTFSSCYDNLKTAAAKITYDKPGEVYIKGTHFGEWHYEPNRLKSEGITQIQCCLFRKRGWYKTVVDGVEVLDRTASLAQGSPAKNTPHPTQSIPQSGQSPFSTSHSRNARLHPVQYAHWLQTPVFTSSGSKLSLQPLQVLQA